MRDWNGLDEPKENWAAHTHQKNGKLKWISGMMHFARVEHETGQDIWDERKKKKDDSQI